MGRPPCCDKLNVKRGLWTEEEDAKILAYVAKHGTGNWTSVPKKAGLKRCGKSCRLRWTNYLRPDLKHDSFTPQEEDLIVTLHQAIGSRWALIANQLPGRTDNDVKNYWNTKLRKKLFAMGMDPVTHKPFSQILADYGNIGGLLKSGGSSINVSLNRDLRNAFMSKSEQQSPPSSLHGFSGVRSQISTISYNTSMTGTGLIQDSSNPLNNNFTTNSLDLLAQLQAVRLVTEASNCTNNQETMRTQFFTEGSSSSSPSSSCCSSTNNIQVSSTAAPSSPFSWNEFLLEDDFLPLDPQLPPQSEFTGEDQETKFCGGGEMGYGAIDDCTGQCYSGPGAGIGETKDVCGGSASSDTSFVEGILDRDSEMLWEFPELLGEPFYY